MIEIQKLALDLPQTDRATIASALLASLPAVLHDDDEGLAEAAVRDAELDAHPESAMSAEDLDRKIAARR